ncbi:MAG: restriction endonuclease [Candidatus Bathyarchaeota archaeon]|nr:MAG: restriction endonuclease [Candidatus Bathyarchaeota archaeon]
MTLILYVTKADGQRQLYHREKVVKTCLRLGSSQEVADKVADEVEKSLYDGMETREILQLIFKILGRYRPSVRYQICLRRGLSLLKSQPDFERFIQILLREHGYDVKPNQIIRGRCVEHEVDAVASKEGRTYIVEVKHHHNYHALTGLDEGRIARAVFEDITEGFEDGLNDLKVDKAMIICNTKFSRHAERYTKCRGILKIGWNSPPGNSLQNMVDEKNLYPITCLKGLTVETREKLTSAGVLLLKQLTTRKLGAISRDTGLPRATLAQLAEQAQMLKDTPSAEAKESHSNSPLS